jgi:hypothetical protein
VDGVLRTLGDGHTSRLDLEASSDNNLLVALRDLVQRATLVMRGLDTTHAPRHAAGGADELDLTSLTGLLTTQQTPAGHHTRHENGGDDELDVTGLTGLSTAVYAKRVTLWGDEARVLAGGGTMVYLNASTAPYCGYWETSTQANADSAGWGFLCAAGTYTVTLLCHTQNDGGLADLYLDGVSIATGEDFYNVSSTHNVKKTIASVVIATAGWHTLKWIVTGHSAGAGYRVFITKVWLEQAAD